MRSFFFVAVNEIEAGSLATTAIACVLGFVLVSAAPGRIELSAAPAKGAAQASPPSKPAAPLPAPASSAARVLPAYLEIRAGALEHDVQGLWSGQAIERGVDRNLELVSPGLRLSFLPGRLHANIGGSANDSGDTSKAYAGLLWEFEFENGLFLDLGLGAATHNGMLVYRGGRYLNLDQTIGRRALYTFYFIRNSVVFLTVDHFHKELGSRNLFRIPFEIGFALNDRLRISIMFDHVSNAYLAQPNEGLDTLGVRFGFRI